MSITSDYQISLKQAMLTVEEQLYSQQDAFSFVV